MTAADESHVAGYEVRFTGNVQGVFFRATAEQIARDFAVTGWVRNETDGSVKLVAEGTPAEVDRFINAIRDAKADNIDDVTITRRPPTHEHARFTIRR